MSFRVMIICLAALLWAGFSAAESRGADRVIAVGPYEDFTADTISGGVKFEIHPYAAQAAVGLVENADIEIQGSFYTPLIVGRIAGQNSFKTAPGSMGVVDFRSGVDSSSGSGTIGGLDGGTVSFGEGNARLDVLFKNLTGGDRADRALNVDLYNGGQLLMSDGGVLSGHVNLNFRGQSWQYGTGFHQVGQADRDTVLTIGGDNANTSSDNSATVVHLASVKGGRDDKFTVIAAGGVTAADGTPVDYVFSVQSTVRGGSVAFLYNGQTDAQTAGMNINVGDSHDDTTIYLGGTNSQAHVGLGSIYGGTDGFSTTVINDGAVRVTAVVAHDNINIINNSPNGPLRIKTMRDGVLSVGGTTGQVFVDRVSATGEGLVINSLEGSRGTVSVGKVGSTSGIRNQAKIYLNNATLKLAEDGSGLNSLSLTSRFWMNSAQGHSHLDATAVTGDFTFIAQGPVMTVGRGGHVIVETERNLILKGVLATGPPAAALAPGTADSFGSHLSFDSEAGDNRLIFFSRAASILEGGAVIDDPGGNLEFAGSVLIRNRTSDGRQSLLNGADIFFTGLNNSDDPQAASTVVLDEGELNMGQSTVHLNNSLMILPEYQAAPGRLGHIHSLIIGDGLGSIELAGPARLTLVNTALSCQAAGVGRQGAVFNTNLAIGGYSPAAESLSILETLAIGGRTIINGRLDTLAGAPAPALFFSAAETIFLTDLAGGSRIDPGTTFMIDPLLAENLRRTGQALKVMDGLEGETYIFQFLPEIMAGLVFDDSNLGRLEGGQFDFDPFTGQLTFGSGQSVKSAPKYAQSMAEAHNSLMGAYLKRGPGLSRKRRLWETALIMGNTLNAALAGRRTAAQEAMGRLASFAALPGRGPGQGNPANRLTDGLWVVTGLGRMNWGENLKKGQGGFKAHTSSLTLGYDLEVYRRARGGLFAGRSVTEMKGLQTIKTETLEVGSHGQLFLPGGFIFSGAASYGRQTHESKREIRLKGRAGERFDQCLTSVFDGQVLNLMAEIARPLEFGRIRLTPVMGYQWQAVGLDPYYEASTTPDLSASLAQVGAGGDFRFHTFKAGADLSWRGDNGWLTGRVHWLENFGDLRLQSLAAFPFSADPRPFKVYGAKRDERQLGLGLTLGWAQQKEGWAVNLDYDALLSASASAHDVSLSISYNF